MLKYYEWFLMGELAGYDVFDGRNRLGTIKLHPHGGWSFYNRENPTAPASPRRDTKEEVIEDVEAQWAELNEPAGSG